MITSIKALAHFDPIPLTLSIWNEQHNTIEGVFVNDTKQIEAYRLHNHG